MIGARERQRRLISGELHEAALSLVEEHGFSETTVDDIAARAGVARRTFFNHYAVKEDAVLGMTVPQVTDEAVETFRTSAADEFTRIVRLFHTVMSTGTGPTHTYARRRALASVHPELRRRILDYVMGTERRIREVLCCADQTHSSATSEALVMLAGTVLRYTFARHPEAAGSPDQTLLDDAVARATETFRTAMEELR